MRTCITLELAHMDGRPATFEHDHGEELYDEVRTIVSEYLEARLSSGVEAEVLETIDGHCIEHICEHFAEGKLSFVFPGYWELGADAANHWYEVALAACRDDIDAKLATYGLRVTSPRPDLAARVRTRGEKPAFLVVEDCLVSVDSNGELDADKGEGDRGADDSTWSDSDRARVDAVARNRQCQCALCVELRTLS